MLMFTQKTGALNVPFRWPVFRLARVDHEFFQVYLRCLQLPVARPNGSAGGTSMENHRFFLMYPYIYGNINVYRYINNLDGYT